MNPFLKKKHTEPIDPTLPEEEVKEETQQEEKENEVVEETKPDRSAYNCDRCNGEGLVFEGIQPEKCPKCSGTGKIN